MNNENKQADAVGYPPGTRIGKYEITERLGIGGQAIVYKAHDALLDRYVAIKQISTHLAENPDFLERFRKEAQILARLAASQPALVTIHELIQEERGLFIVMEYVSGNTLETMLSNSPGPVEPKAVLQILWRLAGGLHAVHSVGVIHRDIKPGNILVGEGLKVKIADFGVAAMSDGQTSMALGTTKYMAPELYGQKTVDARADMYSLGFIAYEMLLGRAKFNEVFAEVVRDKHSEALRWMKWHGNEQVKAPALNEVNPAIPRPLADIVATMMAKNPEHRFASMEQLGRAVKASFSPRAVGQRDAGLPARSPNGSLASGQDETSALESGEELEVSAGSEGPATAPLPSKRLPLKTKLIYAGAAMLALMLVIVAWSIYTNIASDKVQEKAQRALDEAQSAYAHNQHKEAEDPFNTITATYPDEASKAAMKDALRDYKDKRYDDAMVAFSTIVKLHSSHDTAKAANAVMADADKIYQDAIDKDGLGQLTDAQALFKKSALQYGLIARIYPAVDPGVRSSVREYLARARQALEDASMAKGKAAREPFWAIASADVDDVKSDKSAKKALEYAQKYRNPGPWGAPISKEIEDFSAARLNCRLFWEAIDDAEAMFHGGKFDEARDALSQKLTNVRVTQPQSVVLEDLKNRIEVGDFEAKFKAIMDSARNFVTQGRFAEAGEDLNKASALLKLPLARNLTSDARAAHEKEIADLMNKSQVGGNYDARMKAADKAKEDNDKPGELENLQGAFKIRASPDLDHRIKHLQSAIAMDEAKALAKDLKFAEAKTKLDESLKFDPDNQEAKDLLKKIELSEKYQALKTQADAAFNRQDFKKAVELYQKAQEIDATDDEVKVKLNLCLYKLKFAEAQELIKAKKYDAGIKLLEECRALSPGDPSAIDQAIQDATASRDFDKIVDEGNALLKDKQWGKAGDRFQAALKVKDTPETRDVIKERAGLADYGKFLELGNSELNQEGLGHWKSALAYFKMAKEKHLSQEIDNKIAETQAKINQSKVANP
jgi:serine/threonine-protein kinase